MEYVGVKYAHSARQQGCGSKLWLDGCAHVIVNCCTGIVGVLVRVGV